ncbi:MAG TPA: endonuclease/exonuclease/phosphatase family protein [Gemmatimonadetes bacterium]|nr:endonuclease/exonuclease/phosphatase family protein [Gemmatimonadota bacterium]
MFHVITRLGRYLVVSAIVIPVATGTPQSATAQTQFDVMTFNIRTSNISDGDNSWPYRKELVVETIRKFAPHVVGMQEAISEQIDYLTSELPEYRWLGIDRRLNGGLGLSEHTPIFYRHAELAPIESGNFWLTDTPDRPPVPSTGARRRRGGGRIVTWARFHHLETGRAVYVFNTHLSLRRGQGQINSVNLILERIEALPPGSTVIVMGDFNNVAEQSDLWKVATANGLDDAWLLADERRGPELTLSDFGPPDPGRTDRIDWILVGGEVGVRSVETVLHNEGGRYPSDHYPVAARLELN